MSRDSRGEIPAVYKYSAAALATICGGFAIAHFAGENHSRTEVVPNSIPYEPYGAAGCSEGGMQKLKLIEPEMEPSPRGNIVNMTTLVDVAALHITFVGTDNCTVGQLTQDIVHLNPLYAVGSNELSTTNMAANSDPGLYIEIPTTIR